MQLSTRPAGEPSVPSPLSPLVSSFLVATLDFCLPQSLSLQSSHSTQCMLQRSFHPQCWSRLCLACLAPRFWEAWVSVLKFTVRTWPGPGVLHKSGCAPALAILTMVPWDFFFFFLVRFLKIKLYYFWDIMAKWCRVASIVLRVNMWCVGATCMLCQPLHYWIEGMFIAAAAVHHCHWAGGQRAGLNGAWGDRKEPEDF